MKRNKNKKMLLKLGDKRHHIEAFETRHAETRLETTQELASFAYPSTAFLIRFLSVMLWFFHCAGFLRATQFPSHFVRGKFFNTHLFTFNHLNGLKGRKWWLIRKICASDEAYLLMKVNTRSVLGRELCHYPQNTRRI